MPTLTTSEDIFKQLLEEMGFVVKFFVDKLRGSTVRLEDSENIYMQVPCLSYSLDFACPERKIDMEVDGEYWHGSAVLSMTASQLKRKMHDTQRDAELETAGWTVFRIPASSLNNERMRPRLVKYVQALFTPK